MQTPPTWIWQQPDWPRFRWDEARLAPPLSRARLAQGKALGAARFLDTGLTLEAVAAILVEDGLTTSAIVGDEHFFRIARRIKRLRYVRARNCGI